MIINSLLVGAGGFFGSITRYLISIAFKKWSVPFPLFPWATLIANLIGCFLIGVLFSYSETIISNENKENVLKIQLFFGTGFLGSLTTFSTYNLEMLSLFKDHHQYMSILYFLVSFLFGIITLQLGRLIFQ